MKQTISKSDFRDAFVRMDRRDNFSYEGLGALYDHLEKGTAQGAEEYELDVIELCCIYSESTYEEIKNDYYNKFESDASNEDILEELRSNTEVVWFDDEKVLYMQF